MHSSNAVPTALSELPDRDRELLHLIAKVSGIQNSLAIDVELLYGAPAFFEQLFQAIDEATHHVHVQFYIWRDDERGQALLGALVRAAQRGVEVRLIIDEMGSIDLRAAVFKQLIDAGGKFSWALTIDPVRNRFFWHLRNHRKLQVIDGRIAFVGGMNVGSEYYGEDETLGPWRDAQLRIEGPAVAQLHEVFADDWFYATDEPLIAREYYEPRGGHTSSAHIPVQVIADGPDQKRDPLEKSLVALLNHAKSRVWIATGYFVPNDVMLMAAYLAVARGVDVRLLLAGRSDARFMVHAGRSYYEELLDANVRLWEYHAGFMHAKMMLVDDWMMVGSANWDTRSMRLNFELSALVRSPREVNRLEEIFSEEFDRATEIRLEEFTNRPFVQRLREAMIRPISPLL